MPQRQPTYTFPIQCTHHSNSLTFQQLPKHTYQTLTSRIPIAQRARNSAVHHHRNESDWLKLHSKDVKNDRIVLKWLTIMRYTLTSNWWRLKPPTNNIKQY